MPMRIAPDSGHISVVLLGSFNPAIMRPEWFGKHGLVSDQTAAAAEVQIIHREIAIFRMDWLSLQVQAERFTAEVQEAPFIRLADFVVKTFRELLPHTPVRGMGINRRVQFRVADHAAQNRVGKMLAPPAAWGEWGKLISDQIESSGTIFHGGMASVAMRETRSEPKGWTQATVQPAGQVPGSAILVDVNDHYEVAEASTVDGASEMIDLLENKFEPSVARSEWIIDQVMALA